MDAAGWINVSEFTDPKNGEVRTQRSLAYRTRREADWAAERAARGSGGGFLRVDCVAVSGT